MTYRSKSAERVLTELAELSERYGMRNVQFVDNILDMSFFKTVLPQLAAAGGGYSLFYETKANLKREQVKTLAAAGVRSIQPGIESLDDNLLRLIGKGNTAVMNVQLLKWSSEFGIHPAWNMLSGIPGDCDSWYAEMAKWLPAIFHLQPPTGVVRVRYDRFSPYHTRPEAFGLALEPSRAYGPLPRSLMRLAYSFEDGGERGSHIHRAVQQQPGQQALQEAVQRWNDLWQYSRPVLHVDDNGRHLRITNTRPGARRTSWTVQIGSRGLSRLQFRADPRGVLKQLSARLGTAISAHEAEAAIETLCEANMLLPLSTAGCCRSGSRKPLSRRERLNSIRHPQSPNPRNPPGVRWDGDGPPRVTRHTGRSCGSATERLPALISPPGYRPRSRHFEPEPSGIPAALGAGDFNGDGHADIVLQNSSGAVAVMGNSEDTSIIGGGTLRQPRPGLARLNA